MPIHPYLNFNGNCAEAFQFYQQVFGGDLVVHKHRDTPAAKDVPPEMLDQVTHARLVSGELVLMASDSPPEYYEKPQGIYVSVNIEDPERGRKYFDALAEKGNVIMPFDKTFWADGFGMCTDRFGVPWMVNCSKEQ
jgi:PhnB protein